MAIKTILANISCSELEVSIGWYEKLFDRPPARRPMEGLAEWHITDSAEIQLFQAPDKAGKSTLTVVVGDVEGERGRLSEAGFEPGDVEMTNEFNLLRLSDPDGNLIVVVSSRR